MSDGQVKRTFGRIERRSIIIPKISCFAEPKGRHTRSNGTRLHDVLEGAQFVESFSNGLVHFRGATVVFSVGHLHGAEFEQIYDFRPVGEIAVKLPPPLVGRRPGPMWHDIKMNLRFSFSPSPCSKKIQAEKV